MNTFNFLHKYYAVLMDIIVAAWDILGCFSFSYAGQSVFSVIVVAVLGAIRGVQKSR